MSTRRQRRERLLERADIAELDLLIERESDPEAKRKLLSKKEKLSKIIDARERMNYGI